MKRWALRTLFAIGLLLRLPAFTGPHNEGDEVIGRAVVEQLEHGRGYTLRGHPLLEHGLLSPAIYGGALFMHPPAGFIVFRAFHRLFGESGFALAQVAAYAVFFCSLLLMGRLVIRPWTMPAAIVLAILAAASPLAAFVAGHHWLDGPLLALATLASALFLLAFQRERPWLAALAGLTLGVAGLVKLTAVLVAPGLIALAVAGGFPGGPRRVFRYAGLLLGCAGLLVLPWLVGQWRADHALFSLAGRPPMAVVLANPYLDLVTRLRPPGAYFWLLPTVLWTAVPSLTMLALQSRDPAVRRPGLALAFWAVLVVSFHVGLGLRGYSRVLRYLVLATPALALLFAHGVSVALQLRRLPDRRAMAGAALGFAAVGLCLELAQAVRTCVFEGHLDLIVPLFQPR
jgi:4-amino-4-deoxy-L-arabinose transferase-like glycosyltransferase